MTFVRKSSGTRNFPRDRRRSLPHSRRPIIASETLEKRELLAGDICIAEGEPIAHGFVSDLASPKQLSSQSVAGFASSTSRAAEGEVVETIDDAAAIGADAVDSFATGLRQTVQQISRVLSAVENVQQVAADVPYLGDLIPESVGGASVVDTQSIQSLLNLASRFDTEVLQPLETFLDSNPAATAQRLVQEFDFLQAAEGLASGETGVRLAFHPQNEIERTIGELLDPVIELGESLIEPIDGDALATVMPIVAELQDFVFDVVRGDTGDYAIQIPDIALRVTSTDIPVDFAAKVGFLAGGVTGGSIDIDLGVSLSLSNLLGDSISLEDLRGFDLSVDLNQLDTRFIGDGVSLALPFDFDLAGFDLGGVLPVFTLSDDNPFDAEVPDIGLQIPGGAPYTAANLLGFHSVDSSIVLSTIDSIGAQLGGWENGDLLNFPIPLAGAPTKCLPVPVTTW